MLELKKLHNPCFPLEITFEEKYSNAKWVRAVKIRVLTTMSVGYLIQAVRISKVIARHLKKEHLSTLEVGVLIRFSIMLQLQW